MIREEALLTNIGSLLERRGKEFLGPNYKDPITSYSTFHEFSASNLEVHLALFKPLKFSFQWITIIVMPGVLENDTG